MLEVFSGERGLGYNWSSFATVNKNKSVWDEGKVRIEVTEGRKIKMCLLWEDRAAEA